MAESHAGAVRTLDWVVIGAALLAYVSSFLPWYSASISILGIDRSADVDAWNAGFGAWFSVLLLVAAGGWVLVSAFGGRLTLPGSRSLITLGLSALAVVTIALRWATFPDATGGADAPKLDRLGELGDFDLGSAFGVSSGAGAGLYLGLIAASTAVVASVLTLRSAGSNIGHSP
ncbi:MAG: hypothetical protein DLM60_18185 [Pseudonocardiales bacterium]|nr:hypothetical protein [Actinomycetota bacterium]PZS15075.1 MAG: hypothetical protein DLM60_18185 [Pseudonocardiales bacterium]